MYIKVSQMSLLQLPSLMLKGGGKPSKVAAGFDPRRRLRASPASPQPSGPVCHNATTQEQKQIRKAQQMKTNKK